MNVLCSGQVEEGKPLGRDIVFELLALQSLPAGEWGGALPAPHCGDWAPLEVPDKKPCQLQKSPSWGRRERRPEDLDLTSNHPFIFLFPVNPLCHRRTLGTGTSNGLPGDLHAKTCWDRLTLNTPSTTAPPSGCRLLASPMESSLMPTPGPGQVSACYRVGRHSY